MGKFKDSLNEGKIGDAVMLAAIDEIRYHIRERPDLKGTSDVYEFEGIIAAIARAMGVNAEKFADKLEQYVKKHKIKF